MPYYFKSKVFLRILATALLIFLAAAAGTGIIRVNLLILMDCGRFLLLLIKSLSGFLVVNIVPLFQIV